jgi:hypothetical protein
VIGVFVAAERVAGIAHARRRRRRWHAGADASEETGLFQMVTIQPGDITQGL